MMYLVTHTYKVWREIDLMENIIWYTYLFMFFFNANVSFFLFCSP